MKIGIIKEYKSPPDKRVVFSPEKCIDTLQKFPKEYNIKVLDELKTRMTKFDEFKSLTTFFYNEAKIAENDLFINAKMKIENIDDVKKSLIVTQEILESDATLDNLADIKNIFVEKIKEQ